MKILFNTNTAAAKNNPSVCMAEKKTAAFRRYPKYDERYAKNRDAKVAGVFFLIVPAMFLVFCLLDFVKYEAYSQVVSIVFIGAVALRAISTMWVARVSGELNRNTRRWVSFALLFPATALLLIGGKKKIYDPSEWKKYLYQPNRSIKAARAAQQFQMAS